MLKKFFTLLIVLYPILSAYIVIGQLDLGVASCSIVGIIVFLTSGGKTKIRYPNGYIAFLVYVALVVPIVTHAIPIRVLLYSFLLIMGCMFCELECLYRCYKKVAVVCIGFFLYQELVRVATGVNIPGIFNFLPTVYGDSSTFIISSIINYDRSSSFFLEPSYFAQFLFPLVAMELFFKHDTKKHMRNALILTAVTFLVRSGNGIFLLGIIWCMWLFVSNVNRRTKQRIIFAGVFAYIAVFMFMPEIILNLLDRTNELSTYGADEQWQSSGFIRFFRGYYLYWSLPFVNQIFGISPNLIGKYMLSNSLGLFDGDMSFINGVQTILCYYGLFGLVFFIRHLVLLGKKSSLICIVLLVGTLYLMLSESYFLCGRMLLTLLLVYLLKRNNENFIYN